MQERRLQQDIRKYSMIQAGIWGILLIVISMGIAPTLEFSKSVWLGINTIHTYDMQHSSHKLFPLVRAEKINFINTGYEIHSENNKDEENKESTIYLGELQGKYILAIYPSDKEIDPEYLLGEGRLLSIQDKDALIDYENLLLGVIKDLNHTYKEQVNETDFLDKVFTFEEEEVLIKFRVIILVEIVLWLMILRQTFKYLLYTLGIRRIKGKTYRVESNWKEALLRIERDQIIKRGRNYRITEKWFIDFSEHLCILPTGVMIWIYQKNYSIFIHMKDGRRYVIRRSGKKAINKLYQDMKLAIPWVYQDMKREIEDKWKNQRMQMIEEVEELKFDYELKEWS